MTAQDLLIVGAGPLGRAARAAAEGLGLAVTAVPSDALVMVEADGTAVCAEGDRLALHCPACLLLAEEPVARLLPIPGWTLAGVTTLADAAPRAGDVVWIAARRARLTEAAAAHPGAHTLALDEVTEVSAEGTDGLQAVCFRDGQGPQRRHADRLVLHDGLVPAVRQTLALGCAHAWDAARRCWYPVLDAAGATSRARLFAAGETVDSARRAVHGAAQALGRPAPAVPPDGAGEEVPPLTVTPADATILCPCEGVSAGAVREAGRLGCLGLNQVKAYTRCGMGLCQGRICGAIAAEVLAAARGVPAQAVAPMRVRFPLVPVTLGALAALGSVVA